MEVALHEFQRSIYGDDGPPMFPLATSKAITPFRTKRRKVKLSSETFKLPTIKPVSELKGPETLVACQLPDGFPPELAFRSLAAYALLRTLSRELRLSPFTPNVLLRALNLPYPSRLLGQIHVNLLRILLPRLNVGYGYRPRGGTIGMSKKRRLDGIRWPLLGGDNLTYLDNYTWPLFYDDYCHLTADVLWVSMNDTNLFVDLRQIGEPVENSDDELQRDDDDDNFDTGQRIYDRQESTQASKMKEIGEMCQIPEPVDTDDEYRGEDDEVNGGGNDEDYKASSFQAKKRRRTTARHAPAKKGTRSSRASPNQEVEVVTVDASVNSHHLSSNASSATNFLTRTKAFVEDTSTAVCLGNILVTDVEVVSGSPLSQAVIFRKGKPIASSSCHREGLQLLSASTLTKASDSTINGSRSKMDKAPHQVNLQDRFLESTRLMPSVPSLANSNSSSSRLEVLHPGGHLSPSDGKLVSQAVPNASSHRRPISRFSLPLNRARNQAASSFKASLAATVSPQEQVSFSAVVSHTELSVGWNHSHLASQHPPRSALPFQDRRSFSQFDRQTAVTRNLDTLSLADFTENKNKSFEVSAVVASELESVLTGVDIDNESKGFQPEAKLPGDDINADVSVSDQNNADDLQNWPQFKAIKRMRRGDPYHALPLDEKLDMLEFLIDELLAIDFIAAEFTKRDAMNGVHPFPYGSLPSQSELKELENDDECGVCGREGDLLCCDECTSSYHTLCLGMSQATRIPEGKWVCPECRMADPCKFGSLRGGKKSAVDWFTLDDLLVAEKLKGQPFAARLDSTFESTRSNLDVTPFQGEANAVAGSELSSFQVGGGTRSPNRVSGMEFLVVGSFIFTRPRCKNGLQTLERVQSDSILPLNQVDLAQSLLNLGPDMGSKWPFTQIPLSSRELWSGEWTITNHCPFTSYFATLDSHDPSFYWSQYRKAPLPKSMKAGAGAQSATLSELENEFLAVETNRLSGVLSRDMRYDGKIARELKISTSLFDPYQVVANFMLRLEGSLKRAGLLFECWGTKNSEFKTDVWANNVRRCQSIPRLARLLVKLTDAAHPRSFVEEWHKLPGNNKSVELSSTALSLTARRFNLPKDWNAEEELRRRNWERCPIWAVHALLSKGGHNNSRCLWNMVHQGGRKRKHGSVPVKMEQSTSLATKPAGLHDTAVSGHQHIHLDGKNELPEHCEGVLIKESVAPDVTEPLLDESTHVGEIESNHDVVSPQDDENGKSGRKRSDRVQTRSGAWVSDSSGTLATEDLLLSEMRLLVENERKKRLTELEKFVRATSSREANWPLAGRKLFEPAGYLPPMEMRRLARKAGAAAAPFVTYSASHEVGQTALSHRWRKRTLECKSYEELILRMKSLESFIDSSTIAACDALMRRITGSKKQSQAVVGCIHRDPQTGVVEYFLLDKDRKRGCWVSQANMELSPLIHDLNDRTESQFQKMEHKKKLKIEQESQVIEASFVQSADPDLLVEAPPDSCSLELNESDSYSEDIFDHPAKKQKRETNTPIADTSSPLDDNLQQKWNQEVEAALLQHELETRQLIIERAKMGLSLLPPESQMLELRLRRVHSLKTPLEALRRSGDRNAFEAEIVARLTQAEVNALKLLGGTQLAIGSSTESVPSLPVTLGTPPQVSSHSSNHFNGPEAMNRASSGFRPLDATARGMVDPVPLAPASLSRFSPHGVEFDPSRMNRTNSAVLGVADPRLPYLQSRAPPVSLPYHQSAGPNFHIPMNVARETWSQNNVSGSNHMMAHPPYRPGSNSPFMNPGITPGMFEGYPQFRNNGFVNHHPYSQQSQFQVNVADQFISQRNPLNSYLPAYQHMGAMGSMPGPSSSNEFNFRPNVNSASISAQQTVVSQTSSSPGDLSLGFDLEPRPIEEMSRNAQDLESLLRRFARHPR